MKLSTLFVDNYRDVIVPKWKSWELYILYVILAVLRHQKKFRNVTQCFIFITGKRVCWIWKINTTFRNKTVCPPLQHPGETSPNMAQ
jgi:hypothetical protein